MIVVSVLSIVRSFASPESQGLETKILASWQPSGWKTNVTGRCVRA